MFSLKRTGDLRPISIGRALIAEMDQLADSRVSPLPHSYVIAISDPDARALDYAKKSLATNSVKQSAITRVLKGMNCSVNHTSTS